MSTYLKNTKIKLLKFGSIGVFMSIFGLTVNTILLKFFNTPLKLTYGSVYMFNILISYYLNSRFTFKSQLTFKRAALYYMVYLSSLTIGLLLLGLFKNTFDFENWIYPFMVFPFTMTYNFILSNFFLKQDK